MLLWGVAVFELDSDPYNNKEPDQRASEIAAVGTTFYVFSYDVV